MHIEDVDNALEHADNLLVWIQACRFLRGEVRRLESERLANEISRAAAAHRAEEGDSELAGECELLRADQKSLLAELRDVLHIVTESLGENVSRRASFAAKQLADAYRSEKQRADTLQRDIEATSRDMGQEICFARNALREAGFECGQGEVGPQIVLLADKCRNLQSDLDTERDRANLATALANQLQAQLDAQPQVEAVAWLHHPDIKPGNGVPDDAWFATGHSVKGRRRRVYLGPPEPIASEVQP